MSKRQLVALAAFPPGSTLKFSFVRHGKPVEAVLVNTGGTIVAYENVCQHIPLTLDYDDNRFFTKDGKHLVCQNHGALYEPLTGLCIRGPCEGQSLAPVAVTVENGTICFTPPE